VLTAYCRHTVRAELLAEQVRAFRVEWLAEDGGLQRLDRLLAAADRETKAITACARALRLTPQSQMHPCTAGRTTAREPGGPRPWDVGRGSA
jgi:hypothetical protein